MNGFGGEQNWEADRLSNLAYQEQCLGIEHELPQDNSKGELIAQTKGFVKKLDDKSYVVTSQSGNGFYTFN